MDGPRIEKNPQQNPQEIFETFKTFETFLAKGKRGAVFLTSWKGKKAVVKRLNSASARSETLRYEARFLRIANDLGLGPKLYAVQKDGIMMELIEGERILDFFANPAHRAQDAKQACKDVLLQCRILDKRGLNKMELTNPYKHIIVRRKNSSWEPVMIDFERCHETQKPKNVTQFIQFLSSGLVRHALTGKIAFDQEKLWELASDYKKDFSQKQFRKILDLF